MIYNILAYASDVLQLITYLPTLFGIFIFIVMMIALLEFSICYRAVWIINYSSRYGNNYFSGPGFKHIYENIIIVLKCIFIDRDLFFIIGGALYFGNYEPKWQNWPWRFVLSLLFALLFILGIMEVVFCVLITLIALFLLTTLHLAVVIPCSLIYFIINLFKGKGG